MTKQQILWLLVFLLGLGGVLVIFRWFLLSRQERLYHLQPGSAESVELSKEVEVVEAGVKRKDTYRYIHENQ